MFADDLSEFEESRQVLQSLIEEYRASESHDYINWGLEEESAMPRERMPGESALES